MRERGRGGGGRERENEKIFLKNPAKRVAFSSMTKPPKQQGEQSSLEHSARGDLSSSNSSSPDRQATATVFKHGFKVYLYFIYDLKS